MPLGYSKGDRQDKAQFVQPLLSGALGVDSKQRRYFQILHSYKKNKADSYDGELDWGQNTLNWVVRKSDILAEV